MAYKFINGIATIQLGTIAGDGGPATTFVPIGNTVQDSAVFAQAADANTDFFIEESDSPVFTGVKKGTITFKFSCYDVSIANLVKFFGGTKTGTAPNEIWSIPDSIIPQNLSVLITADTGQQITINNGLVSPLLNWAIGRSKLAQIDCTVTIQQPTKAGVPRLTVTTDE